MEGRRTLTRRECLAMAVSAPFAGLQSAPARPNVLLLLTDDHHWQCLGAAGNPHVLTPNLDRLAARGVHFTNGICSTPQCSPSRGMLLSGLESYQTGLISNEVAGFRKGLGPTVVEQMRRGGYQTILIGKWGVGEQPGPCGFSRAPLWNADVATYRDPLLCRGLDGVERRMRGWATDLLVDAAIEAIEGVRQPFLLWLACKAPHKHQGSWQADRRYRQPYEGRNPTSLAPPGHPAGGKPFDWIAYYSAITHLDAAIGRLVAALEKANLWSNTIAFVLGDNGLMCGTKGLQGKIVPWEESIRVPFLAGGGLVKGPARSDAAAASIDLPATWLDLAGIAPASPLAGRSLKSYLQQREGALEVAFAAWDDPGYHVRVEPYRLARDRQYKYIVWQSGREELYNWRADPREEENLIGANGARRPLTELREQLLSRMNQTSDGARSWVK